MKIKILGIAFCVLFLFNGYIYAQKKHLSLIEAIKLSQETSLDYKVVKNVAQSGYWEYKQFKMGLLPSFSLVGIIPSYNRTINKITTPSGEDIFVAQNQAYSNLNLNVTQRLGFSGGTFVLNTSLNRIDIFGRGNQFSPQYFTVPFSISYTQPSLFFNPMKWDRKIVPLQYEESKKKYSESIEQVSLNTLDKYFQLLEAQVQLTVTIQNLSNADTLLKITAQKFNIGTRDRNDFLQAKLNLLNAKNNYVKDKLSLNIARQDLNQYLNFSLKDSLEVMVPDDVKFFPININKALEEASQNRQKVVEFRRRRLEAERNVAETKAESGPTFSVNANLGLSQSNNQFLKAYQDLQRQQSVVFQFSVPLIDWGENKSKRMRAKADLELTQNTIQQEQIVFEQEILLQTQQWNILESQLLTADETKAVSLERYEVARQRYLLGTINFTEFNNAQEEKDSAVLLYISILKSFWTAYYTIRKLTLYDFKNNKKLEFHSSTNTN